VNAYSRIFVPACADALRGVDKGRTRRGCLRGATLISVVALIFTALNKGSELHIIGRIAHVCSFRAVVTSGGRRQRGCTV